MGWNPEHPNPNRERFFSGLGLEVDRVVALRQTHSRDVAVVESFSPASFDCGDGLASADPAAILSVTVADCLPVFLADRRTGAFALLHSGWKGTGIAIEALELMRGKWGTRPADVAAILGPCIRGCCYEVDPDRARSFEAEFAPRCRDFPLGPLVRREEGRCFIDLQAANASLLENAGIADLAVCQDCTFTDDRLGSFRREGSDRFTRMAALFGRLPEEPVP